MYKATALFLFLSLALVLFLSSFEYKFQMFVQNMFLKKYKTRSLVGV